MASFEASWEPLGGLLPGVESESLGLGKGTASCVNTVVHLPWVGWSTKGTLFGLKQMFEVRMTYQRDEAVNRIKCYTSWTYYKAVGSSLPLWSGQEVCVLSKFTHPMKPNLDIFLF